MGRRNSNPPPAQSRKTLAVSLKDDSATTNKRLKHKRINSDKPF